MQITAHCNPALAFRRLRTGLLTKTELVMRRNAPKDRGEYHRVTTRQIMLAMKLTPLLLLIAALQVNAKTSAQTVSNSGKAVSLQKLFASIKEQTNYTFFYRKEDLNSIPPISIKLKEEPLLEALEEILMGQPLEFEIQGKTVFITKKIPITLKTPDEFIYEAPSVSVSGIVRDTLGAVLGGVSIKVKNTENGTTTDVNGAFSLTGFPENSVLVISYVGYQTLEIPFRSFKSPSRLNLKNVKVIMDSNGLFNLDITLLHKDSQMEGVVVVGYGTQKKLTMTSAISTVKGDDIGKSPVADLSNSLGGRLAGVLSKQNSGEPGSDAAEIHIRGISTLGNSSALLIVDGVPRNYSYLDPNSIEAVSVLKDAAAVAPYGLAGSNGVILVTTKKGKTGTPTFDYNGYYGWSNPIKLVKTANSYEYAQIENLAYLNSHPGQEATVPYNAEAIEGYRKVVEHLPGAEPDKYFNSNNLGDVIRHNAPQTNHSFQVTGGTNKIRYFASLGYIDQASMMPNESFARYNAMLNLETEVTQTTKISLSVNYIRKKTNRPGYQVAAPGPNNISGAYFTTPVEPIYYSNGLWAAGSLGYNIVGRIYESGKANSYNNSTYSSLSIEQQLPFIKGLSIKGTLNYDPTKDYSHSWYTDPFYYAIDYSTTPYTFNKIGPNTRPELQEGYSQNQAITAQGFINYQKNIGKHSFTGLFVAEARQVDYNSFSTGRKNYSIPIQTIDQGSSDASDLSNGGTQSGSRQIGYVTRLSYNYDTRYMVEVSGRYDGHYYFAPQHRWGFFPAVSMGWRLSEEKFLKGAKAIDNLKIRGSWGLSGNLAGQPFQYLSTYSPYAQAWRMGGTLQQGLTELSPANTNITWEKQRQYDVGLDGSFWNGLLNFEIDYFHQRRNNMLMQPSQNVPVEYGIGIAQENIGVMSNRGVEITLGSTHTFSSGLILNLSGTFTQARNKTIEIFENTVTYNNPNQRRTGLPLNSYFGLKSIGYFQTEEEVGKSPVQNLGSTYGVGDVKYADINNDGQIDEKDVTLLSTSLNYPDILFGLTANASWKGFDVSLLFQGATKNRQAFPGPGSVPGVGGGPILADYVGNYWTPEHRDAKYPRISQDYANNYPSLGADWYWRDGTYVRLKNFVVGYTIPKIVASHLNIRSVRIYVAGQNMLTWAKEINDQDPESSTGGRDGTFINQKIFTLGINLKF